MYFSFWVTVIDIQRTNRRNLISTGSNGKYKRFALTQDGKRLI